MKPNLLKHIFPWGLLVLGLTLSDAVSAATRLLPFQGKLTDATGRAVADGAKVVQFKIYNAPIGGQSVWAGEVQKLTVNSGLVSTMLGSKASLQGVDFNQELYLELTIDANGDDQITSADPPLLPRQSIVPAVFALESGHAKVSDLATNSLQLAGGTWSDLLTSNDPRTGLLSGNRLVPGSIQATHLSTSIEFRDPRTVALVQGVLRTLPGVIDRQLQGSLADGGVQIRADLELLRGLAGDQWAGEPYRKYRDLLALVEGGLGQIPPNGMAFIPGGPFEMGNAFPNEGLARERPVHPVVLSPYFIDKTEVTLELWEQVRVWAIAHGYSDQMQVRTPDGRSPQQPTFSITWFNALIWCNARSEREGLTPVYYLDESFTQVYRGPAAVPLTAAQVRWSANGYRLPTEAEWEKAARGGQPGLRYPWGNVLTAANANYLGSGDPYEGQPVVASTPVGSYAPNAFGLFDMAGNVWEWCWDALSEDVYAQHLAESNVTGLPVANPKGVPIIGDPIRVVRGGGFTDGPEIDGFDLRVAGRNYNNPHIPSGAYSTGFRCVRSIP